MEFRQFRVFVAAADALNFARAAESLGIAQPAVSQHIKALETSLGFALFHRIRRGVELTPAGAAFLPQARAAVAQSELALRVAAQAYVGEIGRLHIGYVHSAMLEPELSGLIRRFRSAYPDIELEFSDGTVSDQIQFLSEHRIDVTFLRGPISALPRDTVAKPFCSAHLLVAIPEDHALAAKDRIRIEDLRADTFILMQDPKGLGLGHQALELCQTAGFTPKRDLKVQNLTVIVGLVAAGLGVSIVPTALANSAPAGVVCRPIDGPPANSEVLMVHRASGLSAACAQFLAFSQTEKLA